MKKVTIIGAGVAGMATGALLAKEGYKVTILEKNKEIGGRGRVWEKEGYKFDMGPSWYLMPEVFENYLKLFGKKVGDYYKLVRLPVHYRVFFEGGRRYDIKTRLEENVELFEKVEKGAGRKLRQFLEKSREIYEAAMGELVLTDYDSITRLPLKMMIPRIAKMKLWGNFHAEVEKYIKNKDLQKILEFTTVFLGGSPYNTPPFYALMSWVDMGLGLYYPMGGMTQVFKMLKDLGEEYGVEIKTGVRVDKIITENGQAKGVEAGGKKFGADLVVSGADYAHTETKLLGESAQTYRQDYWDKATLSPGAMVIYLGLEGKTKNLEHHNLYFSESWQEGFEEVYRQGRWPKDPSYYVHVPSVTDKSVAPKGGETIMILVPVAPYLKDDDKTRVEQSDKIIAHLEKLTGEKISQKIKVKRIYTHKDFMTDYNALGGAAFGLAHTLFQSAIFRPKNRSRKVKNLYYVGQYTNPGVGVPMGLLSAQIGANLIKKYEKL